VRGLRAKHGEDVICQCDESFFAEPVEGPINDQIDDAYLAKYHGSPYLSTMSASRTRAAIVKVMPRETNA
jgi:hypothetical protein